MDMKSQETIDARDGCQNVVVQLRPKKQADAPRNVWDAMLKYAIENGQISEKPRG